MYRKIVSYSFILLFSVILVVSMIGDLIGWLDMSAIYPFFEGLLVLSVVVGIILTAIKILSNYWHLNVKNMLIYFLKIVCYYYSISMGFVCLMIHLNIRTVELGFKFYLAASSLLLFLYVIAYLLDHYFKEYLVEIAWDNGEKEIVPMKAWGSMNAITKVSKQNNVANKAGMTIVNHPKFDLVQVRYFKDKSLGIASKGEVKE